MGQDGRGHLPSGPWAGAACPGLGRSRPGAHRGGRSPRSPPGAGVSERPRPADRGRGRRRLLRSRGPGLCHIRKFTRRRLTRCPPELGLLRSVPSPVLSLPSPLSFPPPSPSLPSLSPSLPLCHPLSSPLPFWGSRPPSTHLSRGLCMSDSRGPVSGASPGPHPPSLLVLCAPPCSPRAWPPGVGRSFLPLWSLVTLRSRSPLFNCETGLEKTRGRKELNLYFSSSSCSGSAPCLPWGDKGVVGPRQLCVALCPEVAKDWIGGASLRDAGCCPSEPCFQEGP